MGELIRFMISSRLILRIRIVEVIGQYLLRHLLYTEQELRIGFRSENIECHPLHFPIWSTNAKELFEIAVVVFRHLLKPVPVHHLLETRRILGMNGLLRETVRKRLK